MSCVGVKISEKTENEEFERKKKKMKKMNIIGTPIQKKKKKRKEKKKSFKYLVGKEKTKKRPKENKKINVCTHSRWLAYVEMIYIKNDGDFNSLFNRTPR